jgi:hypothetical protein
MPFIFTADCHLCLRNVKMHRNMTKDSLISFCQIISLCIENNADLVIGGDLFDAKTPESEAILNYKDMAEQLLRAGLSIYFVQGQHERSNPPWALSGNISDDFVSGQVRHLDNKKFVLSDGTSITGLDWRRSQEWSESVGTVPSADVFVGHQVWKDFNYGAPEASLSDLEGRFPLILIGDYHIQFEKIIGDSTAYLPGSISMMSIDEEIEKSVLLFNSIEDKPEKLPLITRPILKKKIMSEEELIFFVQDPPEMLHNDLFDKPMLDITFDPSVAGAIGKIRKAFSEVAYLWIRPIKITDPATETDEALPIGSSEDGVKIAIAASLKGAEKDIASALWETKDIPYTLDEIMEELL